MGSVYSVGQVNSYIKMMFTQDFLLNRIYVKGEVSNCKYHTSGHIYFSLKDETGAISCILFAGARKNLSFRLENGQQVVVFGSISVYERDGTYQLYAREIRLDGLGALYEQFEALKQELEEMGMFAPEYKQPIPRYIRRLGVVTAPTGAAVRDIIQIAKRRNPGIQILLYPAKVQGEGAAESVACGIEVLDRLGVDTIIAGRGGGSIEDLWAFNEEIVARAIFECRTPIISAVGHETDTTIADFAADLRAPTPSAGAELAVADMQQVLEEIRQETDRLRSRMLQKLSAEQGRLEQYRLRLRMNSPQSRIREQHQLLIERENQFRYQMKARLEACRNRLLLDIERMKGLSPLLKLEQGYAFVADEEGRRIVQAAKIRPGDPITLYLADGRIDAVVRQVTPAELPRRAASERCREKG
ncbi:MAG: exodeoxyribonuclease VII large subunit [Lachnospiraceae bacterium]|nr:exodeoxyribonuclease VII large subunit [Lachnospiraceae bacterium]